MGITQQIGASSLIKPGVVDNTAARPASPYEGQVIFQKDTDQLLVWNGTAWRILSSATVTNGSVLQIVTGSYATQTGATTSYVASGLTASITPQSTTNKVLISVTMPCSTGGSGVTFGARIIRRIASTDTTLDTWTYGLYNSAGSSYGTWAQTIIDSPSTISACTYRVEFTSNGSTSVYAQVGNTTSNIILQEIAG